MPRSYLTRALSVIIQSNNDEKRYVLSSLRKLCKDSMFIIELGRLFQALYAATENVRLPRVERRVDGMINDKLSVERRQRRALTVCPSNYLLWSPPIRRSYPSCCRSMSQTQYMRISHLSMWCMIFRVKQQRSVNTPSQNQQPDMASIETRQHPRHKGNP